MIVDTSTLLAILFAEEDAETFMRAVARAPVRRMSVANFVEAAARLARSDNPIAQRQLDDLIDVAGIALEPVTIEQAYLARRAYEDFGKGRHPARLNFGDCFAYALAKATGEPLLYKGEDFARTDVEAAAGSP